VPNLSDVKGCVSDLSISPTSVRPNSNCLYTLTGSAGSYPQYASFYWAKDGWDLGLDGYQENVAVGTSNFTLRIQAGGEPPYHGGYYDESFTITVSSGAPICVEAPQQ